MGGLGVSNLSVALSKLLSFLLSSHSKVTEATALNHRAKWSVQGVFDLRLAAEHRSYSEPSALQGAAKQKK